SFSQFVRFKFINKPFLSQTILKNSENLTKEFQECFENFHEYDSLTNKRKQSEEEVKCFLEKLNASVNKFKTNIPFEGLESIIISEIKEDLNPKK
ncbi:MAG TPA: hypothetical protein PK772_05735, partial [Chitinophagaceae bacterium]|nr:hypothetical protein [Chitinophagaceae bacterium]